MTGEEIKADFLVWSGGFEPESRWEITVYVDYARDKNTDPEFVRRVLMDWLEEFNLQGIPDR
jgi:hypothetical protein